MRGEKMILGIQKLRQKGFDYQPLRIGDQRFRLEYFRWMWVESLCGFVIRNVDVRKKKMKTA